MPQSAVSPRRSVPAWPRKAFVLLTRHRNALVVLVVLVWFLSTAVVLSSPPRVVARLVDDLTQTFVAAVAAGATGMAAAVTRGRTRRAWGSLAVATGFWSLGQAAWTLLELRHGADSPVPSVADLGFLIFPVGVAFAIWQFPTEQPGLRRRDIVDGLILTTGLASMIWTTSLRAVLDGGYGTTPGLVVSLIYPVADSIIVVMALMAHSRGGPHRDTLARLTTALLAMTASDLAFAYLNSHGLSTSGSATSTGWTAAFTLIAVAALRQPVDLVGAGRRPTEAGSATQGPRSSWALPYGPVVAALTASAVKWAMTGSADAVGVGLLGAALLLTALRERWAIRDHQALLTEVAEHRADLEQRVSFDPLTGLANRRRFCDLLEAALAEHRVQRRPVTVVLCDLDGFTTVNDELGHQVGDAVLVEVARRLDGVLGERDLLARLESDEFAVLTHQRTGDPGGRGQALATQLHAALAAPVTIGAAKLSVRAALGITEVTARQQTPSLDRMLSQADIALRAAKRSGFGQAMTWHEGLTLPEAGDWQLRPLLDDALAAGEIVPWYQPVIDLPSGRLVGFEALARWTHGGEVLLPNDFLPVAGRAGMMPELTRQVLTRSVRQLLIWRRLPGHEHLTMAVNVPPSLIIDSTFPACVAEVLTEYPLEPGALFVEITEEALLTDLAMAATVAHRLRAMRMRLALDDFGAGYSSLMHLHRLPLDTLKLDRSFVQSVDTDADGRRLLRGLVTLCRDLGLDVVAEGIERPSQLQALREMGCGLGQGNLIGRPAPVSNYETLLSRTTTEP